MIKGIECFRCNRMAHPFITLSIHIELSSKWDGVAYFFCTLVYRRSIYTMKRPSNDIRFNKVLLHFGSKLLHNITQMTKYRIYSSNGMMSLHHIYIAHYGEYLYNSVC